MPPVIRSPHPRDRSELLELYERSFRSYGANQDQGRWQLLRESSLVAEVDGRVVGLACYSRLGVGGVRFLEPLLGTLEPTTRALLTPHHAIELPVRVEAPEGFTVTARPDDWALTALAVRTAYRRRGIGTALAHARIGLARQQGVGNVFVHCVVGAGSRELYESLGFTPLLTMETHYRSGDGMTLLVLRLGSGSRPRT